jgi:hypothetical protein
MKKNRALLACFFVSYSYSMASDIETDADIDAGLFIKEVRELPMLGVSDGFTTGHAFTLFVAAKEWLLERDNLPPLQNGAFLAAGITSFYSSMVTFAHEVANRRLVVAREPDMSLRAHALQMHRKKVFQHAMVYGIVPAVVSASCFLGSALQTDNESQEFLNGFGITSSIIAGVNMFDVLRHGLLVHRQINKIADERDIMR